jgi:hypothetical protein
MTDQAQANNASQDTRKTVYLNRLSLYSGDGRDAPRLYWAIFDGNPRIVVRTQDPNDKDNNYGTIVAPMDPIIMSVLSDIIRQAADAEPGWRQKITNKSTWHNGQKLQEPTRINDIIVGKDSEGCVYIALHEDNRPNLRFLFGPSSFHYLIKNDGSPLSKAELSVLFAKGYANMVMQAVGTIIGYSSYAGVYKEHEGEKNTSYRPSGNNGGNYSNGGNRGNWGNKGNWNNRGNGQWNNRSNGGGNRGNWNNNNRGNGNWNRSNSSGGAGQYQQQQSQQSLEDDDIQY